MRSTIERENKGTEGKARIEGGRKRKCKKLFESIKISMHLDRRCLKFNK